MSNLVTANVIFKDSKYNYQTSVNGNLSDKELKKYFVGTAFNMGVYPIENFQTCINCTIERN